jgi:hypothetical protein
MKTQKLIHFARFLTMQPNTKAAGPIHNEAILEYCEVPVPLANTVRCLPATFPGIWSVSPTGNPEYEMLFGSNTRVCMQHFFGLTGAELDHLFCFRNNYHPNLPLTIHSTLHDVAQNIIDYVAADQ